jgi:hypothetical protein
MARPMHKIEMPEISDEFARCWERAGYHIQACANGSIKWLKANLNSLFLEHLSFRLGNQLFFVRLEATSERLEVPGSRAGLLRIADACKGHACLMPMVRRSGSWTPATAGWGLVDARSGRAIEPAALVTGELIEMTDWELHDFAVQVVRDGIESDGRELMSWQSDPSVDPSIWFVGERGPEWVVVRAVRFPRLSADIPSKWKAVASRGARLSRMGHFASVGVASADDAFDPARPVTPLWRGHGMSVRHEGLQRLT